MDAVEGPRFPPELLSLERVGRVGVELSGGTEVFRLSFRRRAGTVFECEARDTCNLVSAISVSALHLNVEL